MCWLPPFSCTLLACWCLTAPAPVRPRGALPATPCLDYLWLLSPSVLMALSGCVSVAPPPPSRVPPGALRKDVWGEG